MSAKFLRFPEVFIEFDDTFFGDDDVRNVFGNHAQSGTGTKKAGRYPAREGNRF